MKSDLGQLQIQVRRWSVNPAHLHLQNDAFSNPPLASELKSEKWKTTAQKREGGRYSILLQAAQTQLDYHIPISILNPGNKSSFFFT